MNEGFGKDFYRKDNSVKRFRPFSESPDSMNFNRDESLAAQCEIPPHIAQYPSEIVSQRGVSHPFALFS